MKRILPLLLLPASTALAVFACAVPPLDEDPLIVSDAPQTSSTATSSGSTASSGTPSSSSAPTGSSAAPTDAATTADASAVAHHWRGTLSSTAPVTFGGGSQCNYRITLRQIGIDIYSDAQNEIIAATVKASSFEEVLSSGCPNAPIPEHVHTYVLSQATTSPDGGVRRLELAPLSTNKPLASLVIEGTIEGASETVSLAWHRTDYGTPLDWRVNSTVPIAIIE